MPAQTPLVQVLQRVGCCLVKAVHHTGHPSTDLAAPCMSKCQADTDVHTVHYIIYPRNSAHWPSTRASVHCTAGVRGNQKACGHASTAPMEQRAPGDEGCGPLTSSFHTARPLPHLAHLNFHAVHCGTYPRNPAPSPRQGLGALHGRRPRQSEKHVTTWPRPARRRWCKCSSG